MKTIEQRKLSDLLESPENNTVKLSIAAAGELVKVNVDDILDEFNKVSLSEFAKNEEKTLILGELLGVNKERLGSLTLGETLMELGLGNLNIQGANNTYKGKTVALQGFENVA